MGMEKYLTLLHLSQIKITGQSQNALVHFGDIYGAGRFGCHCHGYCMDEGLQRRLEVGWEWEGIQFSSCVYDYWTGVPVRKWCNRIQSVPQSRQVQSEVTPRFHSHWGVHL